MTPTRFFAPRALAVSVALIAGPVSADELPPEAGASSAAVPDTAPLLPIQRTELGNGLRVVLSPQPGTANVGVCVTYDVGARNESAGQRGFAHLFEHMMFQGSRNVPKGDHFRLIAARGGRANGTTSSERTNYYEVLPKEDLALALWLEADRMKTLAITQEKFENQRAVVQEEYRMRVTNQAYATGRLRLQELAFQGYTPYEHSAIGSMDDLDVAKLEWVREFHAQYYGPANAVLSIAGDFDPVEALKLVEHYFGSAEPGTRPPPLELPEAPRQTSERLSVVEDSNAKTPGVYFGWVIPPGRTLQYAALELAAKILAAGESSVLHQELVREKDMARDVRAFTLKHRGLGLFAIRLLVTPRSSIDKVQKELEHEITKLRISGPTEAELDRAKAAKRAELLFGLQANASRAKTLGLYETLWGDASLINRELDRYASISRQDVRGALVKYITQYQRTIVEVYPPGWVKDEYPAILRRTHIVAKGDTLIGIANQYGVAVADITKENKISRNKAIYPGQKLIVPKPTRRSGARGKRAPGKTHVVEKGESLSGIALKHGIDLGELLSANHLKKDSTIIPGQELSIPSGSGSSRAPRKRVHVVSKGESLGGIALKYGVSVAELTRTNNLSSKGTIFPGQELTVPSTSTGNRSTRRAPKPRRGRVHIVKKGDTLIGIAKRYGVPVSEITANNKRVGSKGRIYVGQKLVVPAPPQ